jgi:hypothetical protein
LEDAGLTNRFAYAFFLAPVLYVAALSAYPWMLGHPGHEWSLDVILYVFTIFVLFLPAMAAILAAVFLPAGKYQPLLCATLFLLIYPILQVAVLEMAADGLSSPRPDDPPFIERLLDAFTSHAVEAQMAIIVAALFATWLVFPFAKTLFARA